MSYTFSKSISKQVRAFGSNPDNPYMGKPEMSNKTCAPSGAPLLLYFFEKYIEKYIKKGFFTFFTHQTTLQLSTYSSSDSSSESSSDSHSSIVCVFSFQTPISSWVFRSYIVPSPDFK